MIRLALGLVLASVATPALAQAQPAVAPAPVGQMPHISVSAIGAGPPVILIPGLATPRAVWDGIVPMLATTHRVYLVQVNGFGGDDPRANLTGGVLDGMVADLAGFILRERLEKPAVIGHSLGGLAAMLLAARHPRAVGRLMVVDALPFLGTITAPGVRADDLRPRAAAMRVRSRPPMGSAARPSPSIRAASGPIPPPGESASPTGPMAPTSGSWPARCTTI